MKPAAFMRVLLVSFAVALPALVAPGCAVEPGGGYGGEVGFGGDYYEPYGYDYGGWGPNYYVGPGRGRDEGHGPPPAGLRPSPHAYQPAASSRGVPSLPGRSAGGHGTGGGAGGGGHGGGGGGGGGSHH
ncbi:MAG: hypothetical protein ABSF50_05605 [Burkholderiaceae bacterium]|jgi:hypothetical protein